MDKLIHLVLAAALLAACATAIHETREWKAAQEAHRTNSDSDGGSGGGAGNGAALRR